MLHSTKYIEAKTRVPIKAKTWLKKQEQIILSAIR